MKRPKARSTDARGRRSSLRAKAWKAMLIVVATIVFAIGLELTPQGARLEEELGLPWLFRMRGPIAPPPEVAVVGIEERTGESLGFSKLPRDWPRTIHGQLVRRLAESGAKVIVFDFDFSRPKAAEDYAFAEAIAEADRVILFEPLVGRKQTHDSRNGEDAVVWREEKLEPALPLALAAKALAPFSLPKTGQAASQFWVFKPSSGDVPTIPAVALQLYGLGLYDAWLSMLAQASGRDVEALRFAKGGVNADAGRRDGIAVGSSALEGSHWAYPSTGESGSGQGSATGASIPVETIRDRNSISSNMHEIRRLLQSDPAIGARIEQAVQSTAAAEPDLRRRTILEALAKVYTGSDVRFLNLYGPPGTIPTIRYQDAINGGNLDVRGKVVFVGYSDLNDPAQPDRFYSVYSTADGVDLSGVEIMASAFANLLSDATLRPVDAWTMLALFAGFGLAVGLAVYLLPATFGVPLAIAFAAAYAVGAQLAFDRMHLWLPLAVPILAQLPLALFVGLMAQYLLRRRSERRISDAMSRYLPENVFKDLTRQDFDAQSLDRVVYGVCLATDMAGFTTISEATSPKELAAFMNDYFDAMAKVLKRHAVDITEFHADTIMSAWIAPERLLVPREQAVRAAIDVAAAIDAFGAGRSLPLRARIGMQDGDFYTGHTGGGGRLAYGILGDTANTAARLESLNKHLGTRILASRSVLDGVESLTTRPLGSFRVVGRAEAVSVVEVLGKALLADTGDLLPRFAEALARFQEQDWSAAELAFERVLIRFPADGPSRFYVGQCRERIRGDVVSEDPTSIRMDAK